MSPIEKIIREYVIAPWPAGGYVFNLDKEIVFYGAVFMPGVGNLRSLCWVEKFEDALDIISKYPESVRVSISIKRLAELMKEDMK